LVVRVMEHRYEALTISEIPAYRRTTSGRSMGQAAIGAKREGRFPRVAD
jgi:hypothetical protein